MNFYDFDFTLVNKNSTDEFLLFYIKSTKGFQKLRMLHRFYFIKFLRKIHLINEEKKRERLIKMLSGISDKKLRVFIKSFCIEILQDNIIYSVLNLLQKDKSPSVISFGLYEVIEEFLKCNGINANIYACKLLFKNGETEGQYVNDIYKLGKVKFLEQNNLDKINYYYTDDVISDKDIILKAKKSFLINNGQVSELN